MENNDVKLIPLELNDKEQFIRDNQEAFNFGALEEFGLRDDHFEEEGEIISKATIEKSIKSGIAYRIVHNGEKVGGLVIKIKGEEGDLELLFVKPECHTKGIGYGAWCALEKMFPEIKKWVTCTPYFEKRNIHFYVNKCGFHVVEFFNKYHPDPNELENVDNSENSGQDEFDGMFRFEKYINELKRG